MTVGIGEFGLKYAFGYVDRVNELHDFMHFVIMVIKHMTLVGKRDFYTHPIY